MRIVKSAEKSVLLINGVSEAIQNEARKIKRWFSWHVIRYINC